MRTSHGALLAVAMVVMAMLSTGNYRRKQDPWFFNIIHDHDQRPAEASASVHACSISITVCDLDIFISPCRDLHSTGASADAGAELGAVPDDEAHVFEGPRRQRLRPQGLPRNCFIKLKGNGVCLRDVCWCSYTCTSLLPPPPAR